ncbi:hypothetical protein NP493_1064g00042 [Ridgeia piscesae]|uniref:Fibrinogen C-terminal domain-containing protein n=1 Tax=Ridgeia piscesae TaxID=27915 RepID=A0AAD9KHS6_RIDPI|nr:hypothetical protein NP493_1064g00042 [Ridgeia piscesae]
MSFHRDWVQYKRGFGDVSSEFWLGNEHISRVTTHSPYTLRVELEAANGEVGHAEYDRFVVGPESTNYALTLGVYLHTSTIADSLSYHSGHSFSTWDNDYSETVCTVLSTGGWWFDRCLESNLNGNYQSDIVWTRWKGLQSLKVTTLKIRPVSFVKAVNCADLQKKGTRESGVYFLHTGHRTLHVYCDLSTSGGGWMVFQRRLTGAVLFHDVSWQLYKYGFGNVSHEYWLGNEVVHTITSAGTDYLLRIELTNANGTTRVAEYSDFRLELGDRQLRAEARIVSVYDRKTGAWWFDWCANSNLNGIYGPGLGYKYMTWDQWQGLKALAATKMMIRPVNFISAADCGRLQQQGVTKNGVYALFVSGHSVSVQCDFTTSGGGWILVERRTKDSPTFNVPLSAYKHSMGNIAHPRMDFWLGSEQVEYITRNRRFLIRFEMSLSGGVRKVVEFGGFTLDLTRASGMIRMSGYSAYPSVRTGSFTSEFNRYSWLDLTWNYWQRQNNALKNLLIKIRPMDFTPASDCTTLQISGGKESGIYSVYTAHYAVTVYCDFITEGGGWTFDDTFGNLETDNSDYWLGNDNIHSMTRTKRFVLRFELTYRGGVNKTFELRGFTLGPKSTNYSMQYNRDSLIGAADPLETGASGRLQLAPLAVVSLEHQP